MELLMGKFKSVEELEKAYGNLEAAFTKKCQEKARDSIAQGQLNSENREQRTENREGEIFENRGGKDNNDELQTPDEGLSRETPESLVGESRDILEDTKTESDNNSSFDEGQEDEGIGRDNHLSFVIRHSSLNLDNTEETVRTEEGLDEISGERGAEEPLAREAEDGRTLSPDVELFFIRYPKARDDIGALVEHLKDTETVDYRALLAAYNTVLSEKIRCPAELAEDEQFLAEFIYNSGRVRERFFQEFKEEQEPPKLMRSSSYAFSAPKKPRTLEEAAEIAKSLF